MVEFRTHWCGELNRETTGKTVRVAGWVQRRRDHGSLIFVDLRDRTGLVQIVFDREQDAAIFAVAEALRSEHVLSAEGEVIERLPENVNPRLATGEIEIRVISLAPLNTSRTPPFYIEDGLNVDETLRLRYRFLDLRRPEMYRRLQVRHRAVKTVRDFLDRAGFLEVETPFLTRSTPEGARDYLVPARNQPGSFYALPQSPQLFKQLLMVSGVERYFQVVRCFRDEDLRADRQPEFTQIDLEASFFDREALFTLIEGMIAAVWREVHGLEIARPFLRISYREVMDRYGTDKPDRRFGMELIDLSELAGRGSFKVFRTALEKGGVVKGLRVPGGGGASRKELDDLTAAARRDGASGLAWMIREETGWRSPIAKFFEPSLLEAFAASSGAVPGDLLLLVADRWEIACTVLGQLRLHLGPSSAPVPVPVSVSGSASASGSLPDRLEFLWVVDFPLFEKDIVTGAITSSHHPFTAPREEDLALLKTNPLAVRALSYDLVLNGVELGSGSRRIHVRELQEQIFSVLGLSSAETQEKFGFLLEAFEYGAPPHGGIALGLDRIIALLTGDDSIRQVIAFPKTAGASCLLTGAPAPVKPEQLRDLNLASVPVRQEPKPGGHSPSKR